MGFFLYTRDPEFRRGAREMLGINLGIAAWGLVTGVTMVKAGLPVWQALVMSLLVYGGSAQLAALPLIKSHAPLWVLWATAFCVNLRFVIFSAQWRQVFGHLPLGQRLRISYFAADLNYVAFFHRFPDAKFRPEQLPYFWGGGITNYLSWQVPALLGILAADAIPTHWGIGFAGVLALLGLALSLMKGPDTWIAGIVAGCAAVAAYGVPLHLNVVVAIGAAIAAGLAIERWRPEVAQ